MKEKILLRRRAKKLEPVVRIGKSGLSESLVQEIKKVLDKRKLIKIKLLQSSIDNADKDKLIEEIVAKTQSELIESVGNMVVIHKQ